VCLSTYLFDHHGYTGVVTTLLINLYGLMIVETSVFVEITLVNTVKNIFEWGSSWDDIIFKGLSMFAIYRNHFSIFYLLILLIIYTLFNSFKGDLVVGVLKRVFFVALVWHLYGGVYSIAMLRLFITVMIILFICYMIFGSNFSVDSKLLSRILALVFSLATFYLNYQVFILWNVFESVFNYYAADVSKWHNNKSINEGFIYNNGLYMCAVGDIEEVRISIINGSSNCPLCNNIYNKCNCLVNHSSYSKYESGYYKGYMKFAMNNYLLNMHLRNGTMVRNYNLSSVCSYYCAECRYGFDFLMHGCSHTKVCPSCKNIDCSVQDILCNNRVIRDEEIDIDGKTTMKSVTARCGHKMEAINNSTLKSAKIKINSDRLFVIHQAGVSIHQATDQPDDDLFDVQKKVTNKSDGHLGAISTCLNINGPRIAALRHTINFNKDCVKCGCNELFKYNEMKIYSACGDLIIFNIPLGHEKCYTDVINVYDIDIARHGIAYLYNTRQSSITEIVLDGNNKFSYFYADVKNGDCGDIIIQDGKVVAFVHMSVNDLNFPQYLTKVAIKTINKPFTSSQLYSDFKKQAKVNLCKGVNHLAHMMQICKRKFEWAKTWSKLNANTNRLIVEQSSVNSESLKTKQSPGRKHQRVRGTNIAPGKYCVAVIGGKIQISKTEKECIEITSKIQHVVYDKEVYVKVNVESVVVATEKLLVFISKEYNYNDIKFSVYFDGDNVQSKVFRKIFDNTKTRLADVRQYIKKVVKDDEKANKTSVEDKKRADIQKKFNDLLVNKNIADLSEHIDNSLNKFKFFVSDLDTMIKAYDKASELDGKRKELAKKIEEHIDSVYKLINVSAQSSDGVNVMSHVDNLINDYVLDFSKNVEVPLEISDPFCVNTDILNFAAKYFDIDDDGNLHLREDAGEIDEAKYWRIREKILNNMDEWEQMYSDWYYGAYEQDYDDVASDDDDTEDVKDKKYRSIEERQRIREEQRREWLYEHISEAKIKDLNKRGTMGDLYDATEGHKGRDRHLVIGRGGKVSIEANTVNLDVNVNNNISELISKDWTKDYKRFIKLYTKIVEKKIGIFTLSDHQSRYLGWWCDNVKIACENNDKSSLRVLCNDFEEEFLSKQSITAFCKKHLSNHQRIKIDFSDKIVKMWAVNLPADVVCNVNSIKDCNVKYNEMKQIVQQYDNLINIKLPEFINNLKVENFIGQDGFEHMTYEELCELKELLEQSRHEVKKEIMSSMINCIKKMEKDMDNIKIKMEAYSPDIKFKDLKTIDDLVAVNKGIKHMQSFKTADDIKQYVNDDVYIDIKTIEGLGFDIAGVIFKMSDAFVKKAGELENF